MIDWSTAAAIVDEIILDIQDRCALNDVWDMIHPDIKKEIRDKWIRVVLKNTV